MRCSVTSRGMFPGRRAFTLLEIMVVMTTSLLLIGAVLGSHIYGLRMSARIQVKLSASDDARETLSKLLQDIRSARSLRIGSGSWSSFTDVAANTNQVGNALQIYPTVDTNSWIRYYYDPSDNTLKRSVNGGSATLVTANSVTNDYIIFTEQDFAGRTLTNRTPIGVIEVNLSFTKLKDPQVQIGPGNYFDFYQIQTRITPRVKL